MTLSLLILREICAKGFIKGVFLAPGVIILSLEALSSRANCVYNRAINAGVVDLRRQRIVLRLESLGYGGAKEGEQEIVQDRFEENY